jgi:hypothetical protein
MPLAKTAAVTGFAVCLAAVTLRGTPEAEPPPARSEALSIPAFAPEPPVPEVHAKRDPFADNDAPPSAPLTGGDPGDGDPVPILPPNAGAGGLPVPAAFHGRSRPPLELLGVSTGDAAHALIESGGVAGIYRAGDRVGSDRIRAITARGVIFAGGTRLEFEPAR